MCGIVYAEDFAGNPVNNGILQQFDLQRHRGTEGFGLFDGQENHIVKASKEDSILKWLCKYESNLVLFHHRFPTSTTNVKRAAHPFSTRDYFGKTQYVLAHNGHISNASDLFEKHAELGIDYQSLLENLTFNDSESLLWDFALFIEGKQKSMQARGGIAFICLKLVDGKLDKMYFARNSNPLNMFRTKEGLALSSEGEGEEIESHTLHTWNYKLKRLTKRPLNLTQYVSSGTYAGSYTGGYTGKKWDDNWEEENEFTYPDSNYDWQKDAENYSGKSGDWLSPALKSKFSTYLQKLDEERESHTREMVYDHDKKLYVPKDKSLRPSIAEAETCVMEYLMANKGHFESTYWDLETDYVLAMEDFEEKDTKEQARKVLLLELAMDYLCNDPEYESEESVSSTWEAICQQTQLTK